MNAFIFLGAAALLIGLGLLVMGIRGHKAQHPKHVAMLIGGMMLTAFGMVLAGFAIAYQSTPPLALNAAAPTP
jgi:drug/metabolite transporter (DMT)-like permease